MRSWCEITEALSWFMSSAAERLYETLASETDLQRLRDESREEDLYLEFKEKADRRTPNLADPDRKNFSKTLSGFANADGGVLVFGVETARNAAGVDCVRTLSPVVDAEGLRARLMDSVLNATQPVVDNVRIEVIPAQA